MSIQAATGICGQIHKKWNNRTVQNHRRINPYTELFLSFNKVFCFKCRKEIKIGETFVSTGHYTKTCFSKFYHFVCYDKMFY